MIEIIKSEMDRTRNDSLEFVGLKELKRKQREQLYEFECWAAAGEWNEFHRRYYDWWMFPCSQSGSYGEAYTVYAEEINELKRDSIFVRRYLRGVELLLLSWGWRLKDRKMVDQLQGFQEWANRPIRLHQCASSLLQFGFKEEFDSVRMYALRLVGEKKNFWYDGRDCSELFRLKILYVHGLSSSGSSGTSKTLRKLLPEAVVYSPDLPIEPQEALELLEKIVQDKHVDLVIGTSMGGMFAQKLRGYPKILVNPSFHVSESMRKRIGVNSFFSPREDGKKEYEITEELCARYEQMEKCQFENLSEDDINKTIGLFGTEDTTVNNMDEYKRYYLHCHTFAGGHRLNETIIQKVILPIICGQTKIGIGH